MLVRASVLATFLFLTAFPAAAEPITWAVSGTMTNGDVFSGWFTFESNTPDATPTTPLRGDYSNAGLNWEFHVGGYVISSIQTQGWSGNFEIFDDIQTNEPAVFVAGDHFRIYADAMPSFYRASIITGIDLFIEDATGSLISSDAIPLIPPDLLLASFGSAGDGWADRMGLLYAAEFQLEDGHGGIVERGRITSISAVPEPGTLLLISSAAGALLVGRRRLTLDLITNL